MWERKERPFSRNQLHCIWLWLAAQLIQFLSITTFLIPCKQSLTGKPLRGVTFTTDLTSMYFRNGLGRKWKRLFEEQYLGTVFYWLDNVAPEKIYWGNTVHAQRWFSKGNSEQLCKLVYWIWIWYFPRKFLYTSSGAWNDFNVGHLQLAPFRQSRREL